MTAPVKVTSGRVALVTGASSGIGEATARRLAQRGYTRRVAGRLPDRLQDDQQGGHLPAPGQRQQRHDRHLEDVPADGDRPVPLCLVRRTPGHQAQAVAGQLAESGDDGDRQRPGAEQCQVWSDDAPRALVGEVREEAHDANEHDELESRRCF